MFCLCRSYTPIWLAHLDKLREATKRGGFTEPTIHMLLELFLGLEPVLSRNRVGIPGFVQKQLGSLEQPLSSAGCCNASCPLGGYGHCMSPSLALPPCVQAPYLDSQSRHRWVCEALVRFSALPKLSIPSAALLPCTLFKGQLDAGVVTDFDMRLVAPGLHLSTE